MNKISEGFLVLGFFGGSFFSLLSAKTCCVLAPWDLSYPNQEGKGRFFGIETVLIPWSLGKPPKYCKELRTRVLNPLILNHAFVI